MKTIVELEADVFAAEKVLSDARSELRHAENLVRIKEGELQWARQQMRQRLTRLTEEEKT